MCVVVLLAALAGCSSDPAPAAEQPRPVTTEESQLLATVRFNNFDAGSRPFRAELTEKGTDLHLQGWIDYALACRLRAGHRLVHPQALLWNGRTVGVHDSEPDADGNPVLPILDPADQAWVSHPLDASTSRLDALLITLGGLGSDRPDNPVLLQQAGAMWLRTDTVDGTPVTVFAGPPSDKPLDGTTKVTADTSPLRLWVDAAALLRRAEVRLGSDWVTADFPDAQAPRLNCRRTPDDRAAVTTADRGQPAPIAAGHRRRGAGCGRGRGRRLRARPGNRAGRDLCRARRTRIRCLRPAPHQAGVTRPVTPQSSALVAVADLDLTPATLAASLAALGEAIARVTDTADPDLALTPDGPGDLTVTVGLGADALAATAHPDLAKAVQLPSFRR